MNAAAQIYTPVKNSNAVDGQLATMLNMITSLESKQTNQTLANANLTNRHERMTAQMENFTLLVESVQEELQALKDNDEENAASRQLRMHIQKLSRSIEAMNENMKKADEEIQVRCICYKLLLTYVLC